MTTADSARRSVLLVPGALHQEQQRAGRNWEQKTAAAAADLFQRNQEWTFFTSFIAKCIKIINVFEQALRKCPWNCHIFLLDKTKNSMLFLIQIGTLPTTLMHHVTIIIWFIWRSIPKIAVVYDSALKRHRPLRSEDVVEIPLSFTRVLSYVRPKGHLTINSTSIRCYAIPVCSYI